MPGMDGTGPRGLGSFTGRGMGVCGGRAYPRGRGLYGYAQNGYYGRRRVGYLANDYSREDLLAQKRELQDWLSDIEECLKG